ncbi:hypothetical protein Mapa_018475 [Marchantia paleacea]|nr:hypothetical protein Mapa_018475 [Marchantia paleacea]
MNHFPWLTIIVLFPISAGLVIPFLPSTGNKIIRWYTLGVCLLEFLLITYIFCYHYQFNDHLIQLKEDYNWISFINFHWRLGIDGFSIGLILLTGFITTLATLAAWPVTRNPRLFYFLMLAMYSGQIGLFASQDILLFFFMWELELLPVYLLLAMWGGKRRLYAATKFILYTAAGSLFIFNRGGLIMAFYNSNESTFDFQLLINKTYPLELEIIVYLSFLIAYAVKLPIIPFHTWLPDTHGEAHYSTCMLLAGILLKMGAYGLIRINMELLPHAHSFFCSMVSNFRSNSNSLCSFNFSKSAQLKKKNCLFFSITYGICSYRNWINYKFRPKWCYFTNDFTWFNWCFTFFLAGISYDRTRTLVLDQMGGIGTSMPKIFTLFSSCSMASLALPGMSGFIAELMIFFRSN